MEALDFPRVADEMGGFCVGTQIPWLVGLQHRFLGYRNVLAPIEGGARCRCLGFRGGLKDRVNSPLSRFVPWVLSCLQG